MLLKDFRKGMKKAIKEVNRECGQFSCHALRQLTGGCIWESSPINCDYTKFMAPKKYNNEYAWLNQLHPERDRILRTSLLALFQEHAITHKLYKKY